VAIERWGGGDGNGGGREVVAQSATGSMS